MDLFVVRHAIAEDPEPGRDDAARELTAGGERKFDRSVAGMRALRWRVTRVLTSPWLRAARTADLLEPISETAPIATELLCEPPRPELLALIAEGNVPTAVVGHEPWLGELIAWLAFGDRKLGDALALKKGSVAHLVGSVVPGGMEIRALIPPKVLRGIP
jgi:phosphohistidine phosphatase